ncbi:MAG: UDP-3-O-(3-hydroxymyristoyl) glucosamine N-acyltransferase [Pseudomonadota bacterium]|jgi:UDP-3-O-[3-hydroxymyristoyl] glucosamine N-acyltransferase
MPTIAELAERYSARLAGDGKAQVSSFAPLNQAGVGQLAFLANPLYRNEAAASQAAGLIVSEADYEFLVAGDVGNKRSFLIHKNPYALFARIAQEFAQHATPQYQPGVHPTAVIESGADISDSAHIGPLCVVGKGAKIGARAVLVSQVHVGENATIGDDTLLYPNVTIYYNCQVGLRNIIHSGTVIGSDGFGFAPDLAAGEWVKVPQTGRVVIGNDVEIGSNTSVDRGAMADTRIDDGCKIDNLVQIAHNAHIGALTVIAGNTAVAGSTTIGKMCMIGGSTSFAGHIQIADRTTISGGTSIMKSIVEPGQQYTSVFPMLPHRDWEKTAVLVRGLDKMRQKIKDLEQQIKTITQDKK